MIDARIETFLTLCRVMNYRRTAEELNMTQPAVTQHIHYLENFYGCKLFIYDRKNLKMTSEAKMLKKYAENVVYQEKKLKAQLGEKGGRCLSIGATKTIGEYVIAEHISEYLKEPSNNISIYVDNTERLLQLLSDGEVDFALVEGFFDSSQYASRLYRKEPFVGLCSTEHPFANRVVSLDEIWNENLILREKGSGTRNILEQLLISRNRSFSDFRRITTISNFGLIVRLIETGNGITFAYRAVREQSTKIAEFSIAGWDIVREFNYVYLDTPFSEQAVNDFDSFKII